MSLNNSREPVEEILKYKNVKVTLISPWMREKNRFLMLSKPRFDLIGVKSSREAAAEEKFSNKTLLHDIRARSSSSIILPLRKLCCWGVDKSQLCSALPSEALHNRKM